MLQLEHRAVLYFLFSFVLLFSTYFLNLYLFKEKVRKLEAAKDAEKEAAKDADMSHQVTTEIKVCLIIICKKEIFKNCTNS